MLQFIASYFFEKKTQLNALYFRYSDSLAEGWTDPSVPGKKLLRRPLDGALPVSGAGHHS